MDNRNESWKKQSSSCLFICHGASPCSGGRALGDPWGAHSKIAHRGRAPAQESAPHLRRARPSSRGRTLFNCKGLFQKFAHKGRAPAQESAPLLRRACPFSWGHALLAQGANQGINQAKIRHSFALKMNVGAGTQFMHRYSLAVLLT
jgi:hypothetical protein